MSALDPLALPGPDAGDETWSDWLTSRTDAQLATARDLVTALKADRPSGLALLERWNDVHTALSNAFAASSLIQQVHPAESLRHQAEQAQVAAQAFQTDLGLDREVYDLFVAGAGEQFAPDARRVRDLALRDFRRAGVDRDPDTRERLRRINERETELGQTFERNIRDDNRTVKVRPEQVSGLPQDWIDDHPAGDDGLVELSMDYPDVIPMLQFATDREARVAVQHAFLNRAWPTNDDVLVELLSLRQEHAAILGYDGWPAFDAEVKMIGTGPAIPAFIDKITAAAEESAVRDREVLLARIRQDRPDADVFDGADVRYYLELVRREQHDVDAQEVRRYFDFQRVRQGLLDVTGRLFGLRYEPVEGRAWHEDVASYDVHLDGRRIGRIHLDLHPRANKFNHAAMFDLVNGLDGRQLAESVLVCNFPRGLMDHDDVVTLFHEFGHLVHQILAGQHEWVRFSGVATEWDFVEAPSQMLEEWAWDAAVLAEFAIDADGVPIPADLVARMRSADDFAKGLLARTQMFYAALSYGLHQDPPADGADIDHRSQELQAAYSMVHPVPDTHFHAAFGHLDGYSSGYYTYMWSLVIAKDMFSAFDRDDLFASDVARRYRDLVLAQGGRKDAAVLVEDFLGRPFGFDSFARWLAA